MSRLTTPTGDTSHGDLRWIILLLLVLIGGLVVAAEIPTSVIKNDPLAYAERSMPILDGDLPYVDYEFEHLPLAVVPMALAAVLVEITGYSNYSIIFWLLMSSVMFMIGYLTNRLGRHVGVPRGAWNWVLVAAGVIPLVTFRIDALSLVLALATVVWMIEGRDRASGWALAGAIAAKGWPIVVVPIDWWRGKRLRAGVTVALTIVGGLLLAALPGFLSGRSFSGVHIETLSGSTVALTRILAGSATGTFPAAGASYIDVGSWAPVVNAVAGLALGAFALRVLRTPFRWGAAVDLIGILVIALMLASPLLSAQFVIWITPFAALSHDRQVRGGVALAAILTGAFVTFWVMDAWWWWAIIVARNLILVFVGWRWTLLANRHARQVLATNTAAREPSPVN